MRSAAITLLLAGPTSFGCIVINPGDDDDSADGDDDDDDVDSDSDSDGDADGSSLTSGRYVGTVVEIWFEDCGDAPDVGTEWQWNVEVSGNELRLDPADASAPNWTLQGGGESFVADFVDDGGGCEGIQNVEAIVDSPRFALFVRVGTWELGQTSYELSVVPAE